MSSAIPSEDIIRDRAAYWTARLNDSDVGEAEREELHDWLLADPRHAREFRAHNALVGLAREFPPDLQARLSGFASSHNTQSGRAARPRWAVPVGLAATLMMALVAGTWLITRPPAPQPADVFDPHRRGSHRPFRGWERGTSQHPHADRMGGRQVRTDSDAG